MLETEENVIPEEPVISARTEKPGTPVPYSTTRFSPNGFGSDRSGFPKKLFFGVGAIILVGLGITVLVVHSYIPGWPGLAASQAVPMLSEMSEPLVAQPVVDLDPPPAKAVKREDAVRQPSGPTATVTVPSIGLRSGPSMTAKALKAVVRQNEKVCVLKRVSSRSGPDWIQIVTVSGRTGWVWASVVREGRTGHPG